ncbi:MAG: lamin tail domain-containing protein [Candidatus Methanofastidiosia archaeon]
MKKILTLAICAVLVFSFFSVRLFETKANGGPGNVVINEFVPKGTEWVELYNSGGSSVDISGWYVDDADCGSGASTIGAVNLASGGYFVINSTDAGDNFSLSNDGDVVVLCDSSDVEIDRVSYGRVGAAPISATGDSTARAPNGTDTDSDANDWTYDQSPTKGSANDAPAPSLGSSVIINEMNNYSPPSGGDHMELYNPTGSAVSLTGWWISDGDGVETISGTVPAGGFLLLSSLATNFSSSDVAYLFNDSDVRVDQIGWYGEYENDTFQRCGDGAGPNDGYDWTSSGGGTTWFDLSSTLGSTNVCIGISTTVVINEIYVNPPSQYDGTEFIELYNTTGADIDISDWVLQSDPLSFGRKWAFPSGTTIPAGGYLVVAKDASDDDGFFEEFGFYPDFEMYDPSEWYEVDYPGVPNMVQLTVDDYDNQIQLANGDPYDDAVHLWDPTETTLIDFVHYYGFGDSAPGGDYPTFLPGVEESLSRCPNGTDTDNSAADFMLSTTLTPGSANVCTYDANICGIVINEVMYNPASAQGSDTDYEWAELYNTTPYDVGIGGFTFGDEDNRVTIPAGTVIRANGYIIIARNRAAFLSYYTSIDPSIVIDAGGAYFGLSNSGKLLVLKDCIENPVDQLYYIDDWDSFGADGTGSSLEKKDPTLRNDPDFSVGGATDLNWDPSTPSSAYGTPGAQNSVYVAPSITCDYVGYGCGGPRRPHVDITETIKPLAQNTINENNSLLSDVEDLLSEAQNKGLDTSQCEILIDEAKELLTLANQEFGKGNYIAANNFALQALSKLKETKECLEELLGF